MAEVDDTALRLAAVAVEDVLIEYRDRRIGMVAVANGFVVNEANGHPSPVIRLRTIDGLRIAIRAYLDAMADTPEARKEALRAAAVRVGAITEQPPADQIGLTEGTDRA